jgi:hypothetical protein
MSGNKLVIANMYRAKNKTSFFAFHQALTRLSEFDIEFHALWDDPEYYDEWTPKFDNLDCKIVSYTKEQLNEHCLNSGIDQDYINKFKKFKNIYHLLLAHYLRKNQITDYYLVYDDDIILKEDINELREALSSKRPCFIAETPLKNNACDKSLLEKIIEMYPGSWDRYRDLNPLGFGFNAGFMGIRLEIYDDFIKPEDFKELLDLFNYEGIFREDGTEILGMKRSLIDTQQQSFFSNMNLLATTLRPYVLPIQKYWVCANFGHHYLHGEIKDWSINMKSKIVHFIGHSYIDGKYYGKPKEYHELVDNYLKENNIT